MINGIILVLVLAVLILAVKSTVKHFRGECSCCGGSKGLIKETEKKLSNPIVGKKTISIEGMTCDHCRQSVEKALNAMDGVSARVNLKKKHVRSGIVVHRNGFTDGFLCLSEVHTPGRHRAIYY